MKITNIKIAVIGLTLGMGLFTAPMVKAELVDTTKGDRIDVSQQEPLRTVDDFKSLHQGDKIAAYCPMMKETFVTTIRNVDSKGHATIRETKKGLAVGGCNIILQKKADSKEVRTLMVCPSGKVLPVECSRM